jgi:hypothetical protein
VRLGVAGSHEFKAQLLLRSLRIWTGELTNHASQRREGVSVAIGRERHGVAAFRVRRLSVKLDVPIDNPHSESIHLNIRSQNMNEYEIGRDFQVLRSRIEHLESVFCGHSFDAKRRHDGISSTHDISAGVARDQEPLLWKPKKPVELPPFLQELFRVPERLVQFHVLPESKTWKPQDPMVLHINWSAGGTDEFYRFEDQAFSIFRITEPNSGHISCTASYIARLVASGRAKSHNLQKGVLGGHLPIPVCAQNNPEKRSGRSPCFSRKPWLRSFVHREPRLCSYLGPQSGALRSCC